MKRPKKRVKSILVNHPIDPKDLRFGNLIQTNREELNEEVYVDTLGLDPEDGKVLVATNMFPLLTVDQCEGIPLTEEWLLKFGFKVNGKKPNGESLYRKGWCLVGYININGFFCIEKYPERHKDIKYVHQLQNLYHALTGEELKIINID